MSIISKSKELLNKYKSTLSRAANVIPPVAAYNAIKTMATPQFRQQAQNVANWGSNLSQRGTSFGQQLGQRVQNTPQIPTLNPKMYFIKKAAPTFGGMVGSLPGEIVRGIGQSVREISEPSRFLKAPLYTKGNFLGTPQAPTKAGIAFDVATSLPDVTDIGKIALAGGLLKLSKMSSVAEAKALKQFLPEIRTVGKMLGKMDEIPFLTPKQIEAAENLVAKIRGKNAVAQINKLNKNPRDYFNSLRTLLAGAEDQILNPQLNIGFTTKSVDTSKFRPKDVQQPLSVQSTKGVGFDPLKSTPQQEMELVKNAKVGTGQYKVGEIYTQRVMGNNRPVIISKVNPDGSVEGYYAGAKSSIEKEFGIDEHTLQPAKWSNPTRELQVPEVTKGVESMPVKTTGLQTTKQLQQPLAGAELGPSTPIISKPYSSVMSESAKTKTAKQQIALQQKAADADYKAWQQSVFKQGGAVKTPYQNTERLIKDVGKSIESKTKVAGVPAEEMKDISGFKAYTRDVYRNFKEVYGKNFGKIKETVLDPFDQAKGTLTRSYAKWADRINKEVEIGMGIKKGSKESAAVQQFGEKQISYEDLVKQFGETKAKNIVNADSWFRKEYDQLLDEVNATMKRIYPNNPEKQIPKRQDYYRHFREMSKGISGLLNIFDSPSNIASGLAGTSEFTKPKSKWLSFAQKRLGGETDVDAVGGFIDYVKAAEYNKNIDPFTARFRALAEDLAKQTEQDPKLNNFIEYLHDFSNDLAGKTNPADRFIQKILPGGRKTMSVINWLNNRIKANVILGNLSSSTAQIFNVPQGIADAGPTNAIKGLGLSVANIFDEVTPVNKSNFINERYGGRVFDRFDRSMVDNTKKFAAWISGVLDEVGTKYIWNSEYAKALSSNVPNPIKFADDATRRMVAGRGIGEVPLLQKSKVFQMVAPFQLEVANLWHVMGDWVGEKQFGKIATFIIASYAFNRAAEKIRGSDVSFDPIQASIDAYTAYRDETDKKTGLIKAGGRLAGEVISNVPLGQSLAAAYPEYGATVGDTQLPTRRDFFGKGDPTRFGSGLLVARGLQDPLFKVIPPFGGQQLKRSYEGLKAFFEGASTTPTGKVRFDIEKTPINALKAATFGEYSLPGAKQYFEGLGKPKSQPIIVQINKGKTPQEKAAIWDRLVQDGVINKENATDVKKLIKDQELKITTNEKKMRGLPVQDGSRARTIKKQFDKLKTPQEKAALWDSYVKKGIITKDVAKQLKLLLSQ